MTDSRTRVTTLLTESARGERPLDELVAVLYEDLRNIAHRRLRREHRVQTLDTHALVHEAYLRMVDQTRASWSDRSHFLAVASQIMRRVLIDYVRRKDAGKRGGGAVSITLADELVPSREKALADLLVLDKALVDLEARSPRLGRVVECRFFGGMTVEETAEALGTSSRTIERDWVRARSYLRQALDPPSS